MKEKEATKGAKVEQVLGEKPPALHPTDNVEEARNRMREAKAPEWPVAEKERVVGVMDEAGKVSAVYRYGHDPKTTTVGTTMSRNVVCCYEDMSCDEALAIMNENRTDVLPVVNRQDKVVGIVTRAELLSRADKEQA